jgi:Flp pilus assembly pilin Flp
VLEGPANPVGNMTERTAQQQHQEDSATNKKVMTMRKLMSEFWADEQGFIISMELILIATICVLGLIVGLSCLANAVNGELQDLGWAVRSLNQSYYFGGFRGCKSWVPGSSFFNRPLLQNNYGNNWDNNWDIGVTAPSLALPLGPTYVPGAVVTPGVQTAPAAVCPPGTQGPAIVDPNGTYVPGGVSVPSSSAPCATPDCAMAPGLPVGPIAPIPDQNVPQSAHPIPQPPVE